MSMAADMPRSRWTKPRVARMALLRGRGLTPAQIASDPGVQSTPETVRRYIGMMGISCFDASNGVFIDLPLKVAAAVEVEAQSRGQTTAALIRTLITICAEDRHLFANILDDDA